MTRDLRNERVEYSKLIIFLPIFYIMMPRPEIPGIQFFSYPAIALVSMLVIMKLTKDIRFNKNILLFYVFYYFSTFAMVISMLINSNFNIDSLSRPILFCTVLYFGYFVTKDQNMDVIINSLKKLAYTVIIIQMIIGLTQLFGIEIFAPLYSMEKTRPLGGIVRIAGTLDNPNIFAWIIIQMYVIIWLFEKKMAKKLFFLAIAIVLVFLSGSRSMSVIFPFLLVFVEIISKRKTPIFFVIKVPMYALSLYGVYLFVVWFLKKFGENFRYMSQILDIIETGELTSVHSFEHRLTMWDRALVQMESWVNWVFGLGGIIPKADNDYVFAITNFGIFYIVIHFATYLLVIYFFFKLKNRKFRAIGIQYIVFALAIGYQVDALSGWNYPILIMFYTGITISILANKNVPEPVREPVKKKRKRYRVVWD